MFTYKHALMKLLFCIAFYLVLFCNKTWRFIKTSSFSGTSKNMDSMVSVVRVSCSLRFAGWFTSTCKYSCKFWLPNCIANENAAATKRRLQQQKRRLQQQKRRLGEETAMSQLYSVSWNTEYIFESGFGRNILLTQNRIRAVLVSTL